MKRNTFSHYGTKQIVLFQHFDQEQSFAALMLMSLLQVYIYSFV